MVSFRGSRLSVSETIKVWIIFTGILRCRKTRVHSLQIHELLVKILCVPNMREGRDKWWFQPSIDNIVEIDLFEKCMTPDRSAIFWTSTQAHFRVSAKQTLQQRFCFWSDIWWVREIPPANPIEKLVTIARVERWESCEHL